MSIREWLQSKTAEREQERLSHISQDVQDYVKSGKTLTKTEYEAWIFERGGLNSWEREALTPHFGDLLLISQIEYCLSQCSTKTRSGPCSTYDEAILHLYLPLLLKRLKDAQTARTPTKEKTTHTNREDLWENAAMRPEDL